LPAGGSAEARKATLTIQLTPRGERPRKQVIENSMRAALSDLPGVRSKVGLGGSGEKYILALTGDDPVALGEAAAAVEKDLRTIPGLGSIASSAGPGAPGDRGPARLCRCRRPGRDPAPPLPTRCASPPWATTTRPCPSSTWRSARCPSSSSWPDAARQDLDLLGRLAVPGTHGPVMLGQVATLELAGGPAVIDRYDRSRNVNFEVELSGMPLGDVKTAMVQELPVMKNLPPGVKVVEIGDAEVMGELFASFGLAMLTGVLCIYIVLVLLFKDFLHPVTILCALPLSLGGAFVGLLVADKSFSMPSLIGLIMLMGMATKNSILLVEYAIVARRDHGHAPALDALLDACHKRARPIIMTTLAMGAGMLPIAVGWGAADPSFRSPMAVAVIGGLITSTVLSLLVVPAVFTYVDDIEHFIKRMAGRLRRAG
jgi:multidrug efflux pump subunit AcrB